ncbi:MAG: DUF4955 domain-containing protein [Breznakibacter sp.]|nr:DUF4955 domain-containing protein [Breznakibacter sp.]
MKFILFLTGFCISLQLYSQSNVLWDDYLQNRPKGEATILPDFSYAGYHRGEKAIPEVKYKVFDIADYGAVPNDTLSDRAAIEKAVAAAVQNGSGIVFFPKGRFVVNDGSEEPRPITIKAKNLVLRGSGSGVDGTELFMKNVLPAKNPEQMWTSPYMFELVGGGSETALTEVVADATAGSFAIEVADASKLKAGQWIVLRLQNNDPELVRSELQGREPDVRWSSIRNKGVYVNVYHQIERVEGLVVTLKEPLHKSIERQYGWKVLQYGHSEEVGVEDIAFVGNWKQTFDHHADWIHDGGYSLLKFQRLANSWIRNCRFTDVNRAVNLVLCSNVSVLNCTITGTPGHSAISSNASTRVFIGKVVDTSSQFHACGVTGPTMATVLWRISNNANTCFEAHASQPRNTLVDNVQGAIMHNRAGGANENLPNHLDHLILWNYRDIGEGTSGFEFWPEKRTYFKMLPPTIVGFPSGTTTFNTNQLKHLLFHGALANPESLWEAQLKLRLGKLPKWVEMLKQ